MLENLYRNCIKQTVEVSDVTMIHLYYSENTLRADNQQERS